MRVGARFVSKYGAYRHIIVPEKASLNFDGVSIVTRKGLTAKFSREYTTSEDIALAMKTFTFPGLPEERNTEQPIHPKYRISTFESLTAQEIYGWTDEERLLVEDVLRNSPENGREFIEAIPEPASKPWPTFDETDVDRIPEIAVATGVVEETLAYERENANRAEVIEALEEVPVEEEEIVLDVS